MIVPICPLYRITPPPTTWQTVGRLQMSLLSPITFPASSPPRLLSDFTDLEAVKEVIHGNREMFEIIVRRYNAQLYRVGMAYLRNHAQTEDAMQNTYLKAFVKLSRFAGAAAFSTWLTRIMINECLMLIRSQKKFSPETIDPDQVASGQDSFAPPARDLLNTKEMKALLEQSIKTLPRTRQAVYILRDSWQAKSH